LPFVFEFLVPYVDLQLDITSTIYHLGFDLDIRDDGQDLRVEGLIKVYCDGKACDTIPSNIIDRCKESLGRYSVSIEEPIDGALYRVISFKGILENGLLSPWL